MKDNTTPPHSESDYETEARGNKLGRIFASFLNTMEGFPDPALFALLKQVASSSPSPTDVEVAWHLLGKWNNTGLEFPQAIPPAPPLSFPHDHGQHFDMCFEWHFLCVSLDLDRGGRISAVIIFFRKAIGSPTSKPKGVSPLDQQIFSTSLGITVEMPGKPATHYAYPVVTLAAVEGGVKYSTNPFKLSVGKNSIDGCTNMFPLDLHVDGPGDQFLSRPAIKIEVHCAAANPLFLQGFDGYVPSGPDAGWYYYSWANQPTTGTVTIDGESLAAKGVAWMDHQWGGAAVPCDPPPPAWTGWCWFEFQFDGNRALTGFCGHNGLVGGTLPGPIVGIGTYVEGKSSTPIGILLKVTEYANSPNTDANYPIAWDYTIGSGDKNVEIQLNVVPTTVCDQQSLWQGGLNEYAEAVVTVKATGSVKGKSVTMEGVGFCESVAFEDPVETATRGKTWLHSSLQRHGACHTQ